MSSELEIVPKPIEETKRIEVVCSSYCGCGHCGAWEWGLTLKNSKYLSLGDLNAKKGTKRPFEFESQPWKNPSKGLLNLASIDFTKFHPNNLKAFKIKPRVVIGKENPPLFCKYWTRTSNMGEPYTPITSTGEIAAQGRPSLLSTSQLLKCPLRIPGRLLRPWTIPPEEGVVAADTRTFPFGTKMLIPGYGWTKVKDYGMRINGKVSHVDLFFTNHDEAVKWGKRKIEVLVVPPGKNILDHPIIPKALKPAWENVHKAWSLLFGFHH